MSFLIYGAAGFLPESPSWTERFVRWGTVFVALLAPTLVTLGVTLLAARRKVALPAPAND